MTVRTPSLRVKLALHLCRWAISRCTCAKRADGTACETELSVADEILAIVEKETGVVLPT